LKHITFRDLRSSPASPPEAPGTGLRNLLEGARGISLPYGTLCVLSLLPFLLIAQPPIVDFANHAARLSIACNLADPDIAAMYRYSLGWIPNLAVDIVNAPLCGSVAPVAVMKLVTAASLVLVYVSGWVIQKKLFGKANAFLLLVPAIAFNLVTSMGYTNFLAGVGVASLMVALALGRETKFRQLLLLCNLGGVVLFFCHIFALAFAMVFFGGLMLRQGPLSIRGFLSSGLKTAALFAVPLMMIPFVPSSGEPLAIYYAGKGRLLAALFLAPHPNPGIFGILLLVPLYLVIRNRLAEVSSRLQVPLIVLALYVLLVPSGIQDAVDIDSRTLVPLAYLVFAAMRPTRHEKEVSAVLAAASTVILAFGLASSAIYWRSFSSQVGELRQAMDILPERAAVLSVRSEEGEGATVSPISYSHITSYATLDRQVFNPLEFSGIGMQPLSSTPAYAAIDTPAAMPVQVDNARTLEDPPASLVRTKKGAKARFMYRWPEHFDYVIYYHHGRDPNFDPRHLTEVRRGSFFSILKVKKTRRSAG
jgi:hypothetical protein